ncbi:hypothetical protein JCM19301_1831 [Jejuia pallidilutea]|uniref:Uncharacterized protein n=1 Tax=Jejuia pallidilutea TaxID=504487 RepID=A0A090VVD0_9FLAO|nr:hypothetical protein JCM19301_1831 [Jejuia pallidilutea]
MPVSVKNSPVFTFLNLKTSSDGGASCAVIQSVKNIKMKNKMDLKVIFFIAVVVLNINYP